MKQDQPTTNRSRRVSENLAKSLTEFLQLHPEPQAAHIEEATPNMAQQLLQDALRENATDIHLEPESGGVLVRMRIDGALRDAAILSRRMGEQLIRHFKVMADLDPTPMLKTGDGHWTCKLQDRTLDLRIACGPSVWGDAMSVRILDPLRIRHQLPELGLSEKQREMIDSWLTDICGMFVVVGPTGSGKTTTLYALLDELKLRERSVVTIEDPVEYKIDGITQMQVAERRGFTFQVGLKDILRMDPDYILVGEVRDRASAQAALLASASGKTLMTTLHSRDAIGVVTSLRNYDLEDYEIVAALEVVVAQRLVRRLCAECRQEVKPSPAEVGWLRGVGQPVPKQVWRASGCERCRGSGYHGRIGIFEVWRLDERTDELIGKHTDERTLRRLLREQGLGSLMDDALQKAAEGVTSLAEVQTLGSQGRFYAPSSQ
jgi:general secretion pathway protein E